MSSFLSSLLLLSFALAVMLSMSSSRVRASSSSSWEQIFLSSPSASAARDHLQYFTSIAHQAGSTGDYATAQYVKSSFTSSLIDISGHGHSYSGVSVSLEPHTVLLNYQDMNVRSSVTIVSKLNVNGDDDDHTDDDEALNVSEDVLSVDTTSDTAYRNHSFLGYAPSGNVTGELVYVNYGTVEDFQYLKGKDVNIDVTGKVCLVRYGGIFRGLKVKHGADSGCASVLIYSDPLDDGYSIGPVYPSGPWRPSSSIQRGSIQYNSLCSGDPGMLERDPDVCGYKTEELIPNIPALSISYGDAVQLLKTLKGTPSPASWHGALNVTYNIGPGPAVVNVVVANTELRPTTIWNVIATINGTINDEDGGQQVVIGNHRDAWVYGAADPNSGTSILLEVARSFGALLSLGWRPQRTLKLCSWDGEEYALLGSTAYGEGNKDTLMKNAVAYLNVDVGVAGNVLHASATPSLHAVINDVLSIIIDPNTQLPLDQVWSKTFGVLGSGSDYAVFLDHLGIASVDLSFGTVASSYGVYHSVYDSFSWMSLYGDPDFKYHVAMSQLWGVLTLRLLDSEVLPLDYTAYASALRNYVSDAKTLASSLLPPSPVLSFASLDAAITAYTSSAVQCEIVRANVAENPSSFGCLNTNVNENLNVNVETSDDKNVTAVDNVCSQLNSLLVASERLFLDDAGVPLRKWFKHIVQAPGLDEGYAANTLPGLQQAIKQKNVTAAQQQAEHVANILQTAAQFLETISNLPTASTLPS